MRSKPDMAAGTASTALTMNTSARLISRREVATPLGPRYVVTVTMATGRTKDVAQLRDPFRAILVERMLEQARAALESAAFMIARDREDARGGVGSR